MATEMPIDQEFGRFVGPQSGSAEPAEGDEPIEVDLDFEESDIEELPDGSAVVRMNVKGPMEDEEIGRAHV